MSLFLVHRELHPPSSVAHAAFASLSGRNAPELVVVRAARLELYAAGDAESLELVDAFSLGAAVERMHVVKRRGRSDCVMLTFRAARVAVVDFDAQSWSLRTLALFNFEEGAAGPGAVSLGACAFTGSGPDETVPLSCVDARGDVACVLARGRVIVIDLDGACRGGGAADKARYVVQVETVDDLCGRGKGVNVQHVSFLARTARPTLSLVYNESRTGSTTVVALEVGSPGARAQVWEAGGLPERCELAVAAPTGGLVLCFPNVIARVDNGVGVGLTLNAFAPLDVAPVVRLVPNAGRRLGIELTNGVAAAFVGDDDVVVSCGGVSWLLCVKDGLSISPLATGPDASCVAVDRDRRLIFFGSSVADSLLATFKLFAPDKVEESGVRVKDEGDAEAVSLYGKPLRRLAGRRDSASTQRATLSVCVTDTLAALGQTVDAAFHVRVPHLSQFQADESGGAAAARACAAARRSARSELVTLAADGSLHSLVGGVAVEPRLEFKLPRCADAWTFDSGINDVVLYEEAASRRIRRFACDEASFDELAPIEAPLDASTDVASMDVDDAGAARDERGRLLGVQVLDGGTVCVYSASVRVVVDGAADVEFPLRDLFGGAENCGRLRRMLLGAENCCCLGDDGVVYKLECALRPAASATLRRLFSDKSVGPFDAACLFDAPGDASAFAVDAARPRGAQTAKREAGDGAAGDESNLVDDEAHWLYGAAICAPAALAGSPGAASSHAEKPAIHKKKRVKVEAGAAEKRRRDYLGAVTVNGRLEIYDVATLELCFGGAAPLGDSQNVLHRGDMPPPNDALAAGGADASAAGDAGADAAPTHAAPTAVDDGAAAPAPAAARSRVVDVQIRDVGANDAPAHLRKWCVVAVSDRADVDVLVWRGDHGFFTKLRHEYIGRGACDDDEHAAARGSELLDDARYLVPFDNVEGRAGVFLQLATPAWLLCDRGAPCLLKLAAPTCGGGADAHSVLFAPLGRLRGFLLAVRDEEGGDDQVSVCAGLGNLVLSSPGAKLVSHTAAPQDAKAKLTKIVALGAPPPGISCAPTLAAIAFRDVPAPDGDANAFLVQADLSCARKPEPKADDCTDPATLPPPGTDVAVAALADARLGGEVDPGAPTCEVQLVTTAGHRAVQRFQLAPGERAADLCTMDWADDADDLGDDRRAPPRPAGRKAYVAVGTLVPSEFGEDGSHKGRILIFEVGYRDARDRTIVQPDVGATSERPAEAFLTLVCSRELKGVVSAVAALGEFIILACGPRVEVYQWKRKTGFRQVAQHHAHTLVVQITIMKTYILYVDVYASVHLLFWRERDKLLNLLAKDDQGAGTRAVSAADFVVDAAAPSAPLGIAVAEVGGSLRLLNYAPKVSSAHSEHPNTARGAGQRLVCHAAFAANSDASRILKHRVAGGQKRWALTVADLDGAVTALIPVDERVFRRLFALQGVMTNALAHNASLHPDRNRLASLRTRSILDGALLWRYVSLDATLRRDLARAIGSDTNVILNSLLAVDAAASFF